MQQMTDSDGEPVAVPTDEEVDAIKAYAMGTAKQANPTDHPCEFAWADNCLRLIAKIDALQKKTPEA